MNKPDRPITRLHITVAAVVEREGRFLLVEERIDPGRIAINQPAGHMEENESILAAVIRETREETTRRFTPQGLVGVYRWQVPDNGPTYVRFCIHGEVGEADPQRAFDNGILRTRWLSRAQLEEQSDRLRSPMVLRCVDDYIAGNRHPLAILRDLQTGPGTS
jgi:ADP-ribose pyrophosphatase YjhB (NUDIX family)